MIGRRRLGRAAAGRPHKKSVAAPSRTARSARETLRVRLARVVDGRDFRNVAFVRDELSHAVQTLDVSDDRPYEMLSLLARCLDYDWLNQDDLTQAIARLQPRRPGDLPARDVAYLDLVSGLAHFHRRDFKSAVASLDDAHRVAVRIGEASLIAIVQYHAARCLWKQGSYREALAFLKDVTDRLRQHQPRQMLAVAKTLEQWVCFLSGDSERAERVIEETQACVAPYDWLTLGDIASARGRQCKRRGRYEEALVHYQSSIEQYSRFSSTYRGIARCHRNIAEVYRALARKPVTARERDDLVTRAMTALERASAIHDRDPERHNHAIGTIHNSRALLHWTRGEYRAALNECDAALERAHQGSEMDHVVAAGAIIIQSIVLEDAPTSMGGGAEQALQAAQLAVGVADDTQYPRLQARAYLRLGEACLAEATYDARRARECGARLLKLVGPAARDSLREDIDKLLASLEERELDDETFYVLRLPRASSIPKLRDILLDAETAIIRKAWERHNRKCGATAKALRCNHSRVSRAVAGLVPPKTVGGPRVPAT